jgi:N-acetylmuramoyl-L-alanine amidase
MGIALALAIVFGVSTASHWYSAARSDAAVIVADEVDVHTGPGDHYLMAFNLHDGTEVEVKRRGDEWYQIELPDGRRGWLRRSQIEIV